MKQSEIVKLFTIISTAYPDKFKVDDSKINLWYTLLNDIDYSIAQLAVQCHLATSVYIPTISDIRKTAVGAITVDDEFDSGQAWGEVTKAIKHYGLYRPEEAICNMNPKTAKVVKQIGWQEICLSSAEDIGVVRGQFLKMYSVMDVRDKNDKLLPVFIKNQIKEIKQLEISKIDKTNPILLEEKRAKTLLELKGIEEKERNVPDFFKKAMKEFKSME